jgi:hypothetical protein
MYFYGNITRRRCAPGEWLIKNLWLGPSEDVQNRLARRFSLPSGIRDQMCIHAQSLGRTTVEVCLVETARCLAEVPTKGVLLLLVAFALL